MNPKTLEALRASIRHWKRMKASPKSMETPSETNCPLCQLFGGSEVCQDATLGKCPIFAKTGRRSCRRTPYKQAWAEWEACYWDAAWANLSKWRKAAQREIDFLESLLPKKEPK